MFYNRFKSRNAQIFFRFEIIRIVFAKTVPIYILSTIFKTVPE
ncbi:hypothetical protein LEP1GSC172_3248 [Leptospira noguchii]|uniref:Uncharacterized protein n=1 Tax=Leptospira noguchii TaxID=28182 RepID=M6VEG2_9LEPT|nr:hypothetical protein LEP1GSC172_3248 [Leptospira noguchii]